jgi:hypothetical protein
MRNLRLFSVFCLTADGGAHVSAHARTDGRQRRDMITETRLADKSVEYGMTIRFYY